MKRSTPSRSWALPIVILIDVRGKVFSEKSRQNLRETITRKQDEQLVAPDVFSTASLADCFLGALSAGLN